MAARRVVPVEALERSAGAEELTRLRVARTDDASAVVRLPGRP
ncbi:hypothetical protein ACWCPI_07050 [Streptomyces sp. NPDC001920]